MNGVTLVSVSWSTPTTITPWARYTAAVSGARTRAAGPFTRKTAAARRRATTKDTAWTSATPSRHRATVGFERQAIRGGRPEHRDVNGVDDDHQRQHDAEPSTIGLVELVAKGRGEGGIRGAHRRGLPGYTAARRRYVGRGSAAASTTLPRRTTKRGVGVPMGRRPPADT